MYVCKHCGHTYAEYTPACVKCGNIYLESAPQKRNGGIYINQRTSDYSDSGYTYGDSYRYSHYAGPAYNTHSGGYGYITPPKPRGGKALAVALVSEPVLGACFYATASLKYSQMRQH